MKFVEPPVSRTDDLDDLLRSYFQAEMPSPWPALKLPEERAVLPLVAREPRTWSSLRSRLTLAASVGLLLTGALLFSGPSPNHEAMDPGREAPEIGKHDDLLHPRPLGDKVTIPSGEEFKVKESLKQAGDKTELIIEFFPR